MSRLNLPRLRNAITEAKGPLDRFQPPSEPYAIQAPLINLKTYFTVADGQTHLLYTAQSWVKARLMLENAGPVAIGHDQEITPVLSGRGLLLPTLEWVEFNMTKGSRIFIAAEAINRVKLQIAPVPLAEQLGSWFSAVLNLLMGRK
jgi:hypothetical protein